MQVSTLGSDVFAGQNIKKIRLASVDCLRGLAMILMVLDHVRQFWHNFGFSPTDLTKTTTGIFLTRWVTHFCAPIFVFLAGTAAYLSLTNGKTKKELSRYLIIRGIILIVLDIIYMSPFFTLFKSNFVLQVLWALGWSMITLSALIWFPDWFIMLFGVIIVAGHNLLDGIFISNTWGIRFFWTIIHGSELFKLSSGKTIYVLYSYIPWVGVMALGYIFGKLLILEKSERIKLMISIGTMLVFVFVVLRWINIYGDPGPWYAQKNSVFTILSFINCEKYPPSLLFLLMTIGPAIIMLGLLEIRIPRILSPLSAFGSVPLFFYLLHIVIIYAMILFDAIVINATPIGQTPPLYNLPVIYIGWFLVVLCEYPACMWYARLKKKKNWRWLKYI